MSRLAMRLSCPSGARLAAVTATVRFTSQRRILTFTASGHLQTQGYVRAIPIHPKWLMTHSHHENIVMALGLPNKTG